MIASSDKRSSAGGFAAFVAAGILLSRFAGLIRLRVFSHYLGLSDAADAFNAAFRIPNLLQNLFGEGVLSASFIPVYAKLLAQDRTAESRQVASTVFFLLSAITSALVAFGVLATPVLIGVIAPGFAGPKRELTVHLVRILFAGAGLLVLSAWCLGILNSHRRFFLSYAAPVVWNAAMILALVLNGSRQSMDALVASLAWGSVLGSLLQFGIQLPVALRSMGGFQAGHVFSESVRTILRNFAPAFLSRGVVQISAYIDSILASLLPSGAVAAVANAQLIYTLPVSLFGMSVSAAELPLMSSASGSEEEVGIFLRDRMNAGLRRIAFFVVPCMVAFLALGDVIAGALMQTGRFTRQDSVYVWVILAGSTVGLLASTMGRLYSSAFYALRDTRTPLRYAIVRVILTTALGYICALLLPPLLKVDARWGAAGLTASAGVSGWLEFALLRRGMGRRIGSTGIPLPLTARLWAAAMAAALAAYVVRAVLREMHPVPLAILTLGPFAVLYFLLAYLLKVEGATAIYGKLRRLKP